MLLAGRILTAVEARDCGLVTDIFPMTSSQKKFRTEYKQWPSFPPPPGRKLNCRISRQGALYNGVAVAFGDMLFEGEGGGERGFLCNLLKIFPAIWLLSINC